MMFSLQFHETLSFRDHDEVSEIIPGLFLSSISTAHSAKKLRDYSIGRIISVLSDEPEFERQENIDYFYFEVDDEEKSDLLVHFESSNELIAQGLAAGKNVLVHCFMGVSRSTTLVIAYLMHSQHMGMSDALKLVRAKRSVVSPNRGFLLQLALFEQLNMKPDLSNIWYRRYLFMHLVTVVSNQLQASANVKGLLEGIRLKPECVFYIEKLKQAEKELKVKHIYKCRACRLELFNQNQILHQSNFTTYTTLLSWIEKDKGYFIPFGRLVCPGCKRKLGRFRWNEPYLNSVSYKFSQTISTDAWTYELKVPMIISFPNASFDRSSIQSDDSGEPGPSGFLLKDE